MGTTESRGYKSRGEGRDVTRTDAGPAETRCSVIFFGNNVEPHYG